VQQGVSLNGGACRANHVLVVTTSSGVSAGAVQLLGSLDGVNWYDLGSPVSTSAESATTAVLVANSPAQYLCAAITTAITGGTVTAFVASA
jgi:hypothetical protein